MPDGTSDRMAPDPLAAELDAMLAYISRAQVTPADRTLLVLSVAPRMAKALRAVLELTDESRFEPDLDWDGTPERGVIHVVRCDWIRAIISAALLGRDAPAVTGGDGSDA